VFYERDDRLIRAAVVLRPEESKKLIAKAAAQIEEIKNALKSGIVIIAGGTTNGYVAREITGREIDVFRYTAGRIYQGKLDATPEDQRLKPIILVKGEISEISTKEALEKFSADDVFIKGANAVDAEGNAGALAANPEGGTVGIFWAIVAARGANLICPVGLEKLIPSVEEACRETGQDRFSFSMGHKVGLLPLPGAKVITEIQAMEILYGLEATHIASGGILGSEGAVVLSVKGEMKAVQKMWDDVNR